VRAPIKEECVRSIEKREYAVVKGGVCMKHGAKKEYKRCSSDGCTNIAQRGGACIRLGSASDVRAIIRGRLPSAAQRDLERYHQLLDNDGW